jgi:hypothetical protein
MGEGCPMMVDPATHAVLPTADCPPKAGVVGEGQCDGKNTAWCHPGVVSYNRFRGPTLLAYTGKGWWGRVGGLASGHATRSLMLQPGSCTSAFCLAQATWGGVHSPTTLLRTPPLLSTNTATPPPPSCRWIHPEPLGCNVSCHVGGRALASQRRWLVPEGARRGPHLHT